MKTNCDLMKIYVLWPFLVHNGEIPLLESQPCMLQPVAKPWKNFHFFELFEDLAELFKNVACDPFFIDELLEIGAKMEVRKLKRSAMMDAIEWVRATEDQAMLAKLRNADEHIRSQVLFLFFFRYSCLLNQMGEECCMLADRAKKHDCDKCDQECEIKKRSGNLAFEKRQYTHAIKFYTAAMHYSPHNHILFSNRALCFIRLDDYWNAVWDGKKAVVLKNTWSKGHYRYCEALFLLGETERARLSNKKAQDLCRYCPDCRDLVQQEARFIKDMMLPTEIKVKKNSKKKSTSEKKIKEQLTPVVENKDVKDEQSKSPDHADKVGTNNEYTTSAKIKTTAKLYFAQILDEHGPLKPDDERLIGQYKDFPKETHRMVEAAGGLKNFLLQSYEFTIVEDMIALSGNVDISFAGLQEQYPLNPTAEEFKPSFSSSLVYDHLDSCYATDHLDYMSSDSSATECSGRPEFYHDLDLNFQKFDEPFNSSRFRTLTGSEMELMDTDASDHPVLDEDLDDMGSFTSNGSGLSSIEEDDDDDCDNDNDDDDDDCDDDATAPEVNSDVSQETSHIDKSVQSNHTVSSKNETQPKNIQTAIVSVQVDIEYSHHEVNTEPFQPYETQQGDILRMEKEHLVLTDQLQEAKDKYENLQSRYCEEIADLEEQIRTTVEGKKITKKELVYFQQQYEIEAKKWQQERKENQEKLKALRSKIKIATESNKRHSKGVEEKKKQYEVYIEEFAKIHCSKFEYGKTKLEKQIAKRDVDREEAIHRAAVAEVIILENQKQAEILKLQMKASDTEQSIKMLKPMVKSNPGTLEQINTMELFLVKLKKEMDTVQSKFDEKIAPLKKSALLSPPAASASSALNLQASAALADSPVSSHPVSSHPSPSPIKPANPEAINSTVKINAPNKKGQNKVADKPPAHPPSNSHKPKTPTPSPARVRGATGRDRRENGQPEAKPSPSAQPTVFDKIIKELHDIFPHYKSAELANFIKHFRVRNNGTLSGFSHEEIISRVTEHILDYQTRTPPPPATQMTARLNLSNSASGVAQPSPPQPKQPWRVVTGGARNKWQNSDDIASVGEDPCIICHDELKQFTVHKLDCGHYFHMHCIKTWLHTQSTCPTCREHALLPEDFPVLAGRMRNA
ncbi:LOW QUALITY PROTEIN: E3 ubiquitin-protein ligase TTC3 [Anomaloglossus baeobatrachus]